MRSRAASHRWSGPRNEVAGGLGARDARPVRHHLHESAARKRCGYDGRLVPESALEISRFQSKFLRDHLAECPDRAACRRSSLAAQLYAQQQLLGVPEGIQGTESTLDPATVGENDTLGCDVVGICGQVNVSQPALSRHGQHPP